MKINVIIVKKKSVIRVLLTQYLYEEINWEKITFALKVL